MPRPKGAKRVRCECGARMYLVVGAAKVCRCGRLVARPVTEVKRAEGVS